MGWGSSALWQRRENPRGWTNAEHAILRTRSSLHTGCSPYLTHTTTTTIQNSNVCIWFGVGSGIAGLPCWPALPDHMRSRFQLLWSFPFGPEVLAELDRYPALQDFRVWIASRCDILTWNALLEPRVETFRGSGGYSSRADGTTAVVVVVAGERYPRCLPSRPASGITLNEEHARRRCHFGST
jgi:hypothetical protein